MSKGNNNEAMEKDFGGDEPDFIPTTEALDERLKRQDLNPLQKFVWQVLPLV